MAIGLAAWFVVSRVRRRLTLTDTGREYAARIRRHLDQIRRDTLEISAGHDMGFVLEVAVVTTALAFRPIDRIAALLLVPYILWVAFAMALNIAIWRLN